SDPGSMMNRSVIAIHRKARGIEIAEISNLGCRFAADKTHIRPVLCVETCGEIDLEAGGGKTWQATSSMPATQPLRGHGRNNFGPRRYHDNRSRRVRRFWNCLAAPGAVHT